MHKGEEARTKAIIYEVTDKPKKGIHILRYARKGGVRMHVLVGIRENFAPGAVREGAKLTAAHVSNTLKVSKQIRQRGQTRKLRVASNISLLHEKYRIQSENLELNN